MNIKALCIGNASYDIFFPVNEYPEQDIKYISYSNIPESGGGPAANAAYLLSKWGVKTAFTGLLGDDVFGRLILEEFQEVGTDTSLIEVRPGHKTPLSTIIINRKNGSRTIINRQKEKTGVILDVSALKKISPQIIHIDGHECDASLTALEMLPNTISILDAGSLRPETEKLAGMVDYLVCSEVFAKAATGLLHIKTNQDYQRVIEQLYKYNQKNIIVTLGERGLIYHENQKVKYLPAFGVKSVDTTAAGDIFHGAFTYGILNGMSLYDTLTLSSKAAALSVQRYGSRNSIPELSEVRPMQ